MKRKTLNHIPSSKFNQNFGVKSIGNLEQCGMQGAEYSAARPSRPLNNSRLPDDDQIGQNEEQHSKNVPA